MKLVFATHNQNKFLEVEKLMPGPITLLSLNDIQCFDEIPETGHTLEENAKLKADYITKKYNMPCFADDTGLLVDALDGRPGVYSARYAGPQKNDGDNVARLLLELKDRPDRRAHFKTVIALNLKNEKLLFKGKVEGHITHRPRGTGGFGYDPVFRPVGYPETFAQLPIEIKNKIGHRGKAIDQLINYLHTNQHVTK